MEAARDYFIRISVCHTRGLPRDTNGKEPICQGRRHEKHKFNTWVWKIPWRRAWLPTPLFMPGESHGQRSLEGYSSWGGHDWSKFVCTHMQFKHLNSFRSPRISFNRFKYLSECETNLLISTELSIRFWACISNFSLCIASPVLGLPSWYLAHYTDAHRQLKILFPQISNKLAVGFLQ